jgi:hypothetical protein
MTIRLLAIGALIIASFSDVKGQTSTENLDTLVKRYITVLNAKGVDTLFIYEDYCVGCVYTSKIDEDKCNFEGIFIPTYIFWMDKGQTFMTKKDNCFDYSIIKVPNNSIWQFFFANLVTLEREEIKIPQYIEIKNGKKETYSSFVDHSWRQGITVLIGQDTIIKKHLDDYYFIREIGSEQHKNINYSYNINSSLKKLQLIISRTIETSNQNQKLQKIGR